MSEQRIPGTLEVIDQAYRELRRNVGPAYGSMMEGYGMTVSGLTAVEDAYKETRKSIKTLGERVQMLPPDAMRETLIGIVNHAARLTAAAVVLTARLKLYIDTAIQMGGGDLLDEMEDDEDE